MCSCRAQIPQYLSEREKPTDFCESCGRSLNPTNDVFHSCKRCGWENDARKTCFACAEEERPECELCDERLCQFYSGS